MQTSFNRGIWSSKLQNRFDIDSYRSACSQLENFAILPQGGIEKRRGSYYLRECYGSDTNNKSLLIPLQLSNLSTFIVEFSGNGRMRILQFDAASGKLEVKQAEFETDFTDSELDEIQWVQIGKKLYVAHKNHPPRKLSRIDDTHWLWVEVSHYPAAPRTNRYSPAGSVTLEKTSGTGISFTLSSGWLKSCDVGRYIIARDDMGKSGRAIITEYIDATHGKCNILETFSDKMLDADEYYLQCSGSVTLSSTSGTGVTFTLSSGWLNSKDLYRYIVARSDKDKSGYAIITECTDATHGKCNILETFSDNELAEDEYHLLGFVGMTLDATSGDNVGFTLGSGWLKNGDAGRFIVARDDKGKSGYAIITKYTDSTHGECSIIEAFNGLYLATNEYYLQGNGGGKLDPTKFGPEGRSTEIYATDIGTSQNYWRPEDVGRYVEINGGFVKTTEYLGVDKIGGTIIKILDDESATYDFAIFQPEWKRVGKNQPKRYPKTIAFYENRLFYGGTIEKPGTVWGSRSQYFDDFTTHADDEYMLQYMLTGATLHEILWMVGAQVLVIGTTNGIWTIGREDSSAVLTPSVTMLGYQSTMSCAAIRPATIGNIIFFAQRNKKILRSFMASASVNVDKATPTDETLFADPFVNSNIYQMVAQSNPYVTIWVTDTDGNLWGLNYVAEQQVNSWFQVTTDGDYESLMLMPQEDVDDLLFYTVKRTIGGETKRYIEYFTPLTSADSLSHFTSENAVSKITGLGYLEGKEVWCYAKIEDPESEDWLRNEDGTAYKFTVVEGEIDINDWGETKDAYVGLPYTATAKTMNWYGGINDTSYESKRRLTKVTATLLNARSGEVGVQVEEDGTPEYVNLFDSLLDVDNKFTGIKEYTLCPGTGRIIKICLRQQEPDPITITGVGCNLK